jgi:CDP-diacylglycerol---glycerol-3-phosphate 3-phosphatidyltransferase
VSYVQGSDVRAEALPRPTFGPSALATPANAVTALRVLLSPLLFTVLVEDVASWPAFAMWVVLAASDGVDGWLARKMGTTRSGAFLDPLADKVLVLGALSCLVYVERFPLLPVALMAVREVAVSFYRSWFGRQGLAVPARATAKAKTFTQALAVGFALAPTSEEWVVADVLLWVSLGLALLSGVQYFLDGGRAATDMVDGNMSP